MVEIGKINKLEIAREVPFGVYLNGLELGEMLMPQKFLTPGLQIGDFVDVLVYKDSEDRLVATTEKPYALAGEFALLKAVEVNNTGAFFDLGLPKHLLVPYREQKIRIEEGNLYIVHIYLDVESKRLAGSTKLDKYLDNVPPDYEVGQEVDLLICSKTDIGYKAIINNTHWGLLFANEVFTNIKRGNKIKGYIKTIREDEKIDLTLQKGGFADIDNLAKNILQKLEQNEGFLAVNDKTSADEISKIFGVSKKNFKKSIGSLYKNRLITIEDDGIRIAKK